jgi:hypothetical protein
MALRLTCEYPEGRAWEVKNMSSNTIQDIGRAIGSLSPQEREELYGWLDLHFPSPIDKRIESDLASGHLDQAINRALADESRGRTRSF